LYCLPLSITTWTWFWTAFSGLLLTHHTFLQKHFGYFLSKSDWFLHSTTFLELVSLLDISIVFFYDFGLNVARISWLYHRRRRSHEFPNQKLRKNDENTTTKRPHSSHMQFCSTITIFYTISSQKLTKSDPDKFQTSKLFRSQTLTDFYCIGVFWYQGINYRYKKIVSWLKFIFIDSNNLNLYQALCFCLFLTYLDSNLLNVKAMLLCLVWYFLQCLWLRRFDIITKPSGFLRKVTKQSPTSVRSSAISMDPSAPICPKVRTTLAITVWDKWSRGSTINIKSCAYYINLAFIFKRTILTKCHIGNKADTK